MNTQHSHADDMSARAVDTMQHWELQRVLRAFEGRGVDAMLLKGAFLKNKVYGNPLLRPMADIDLLVKKNQKKDALTALADMGYVNVNAREFFAEDERGVTELVRREEHFSHYIDLHTQLVNLPGLRAVMNIPDGLAWDECEKIFIEGIPCYGMKPEMLFLYLCYHVSLHHGFYGGMWYQDLSEVLNASGAKFSWGYFLKLARKCGMERAAYLTLRESGIISQCADIDFPAAAEKRMTAYEKSLMESLIKGKKHVRHEDYLLAVLLISGAGAKMHFLLGYILAWLRAGARHGAPGLFFSVRHILSRFTRMSAAAARLLLSRGA